jgi:hypothetical protein
MVTSFAIVFSCLLWVFLPSPNPAFGQASAHSVPWLEDFAQLKREMAAHYANLEWAVAERQIDLKQLSEQTESRLRQAPNDDEARGVIESFLRAFRDGHLVVDWPTQSPKPAEAKSAARPQSLSSRLGFHQHKVAPGIAFSRLECFRELGTADSKYFAVGSLSLPGGKRVGLLRIAIFSEYFFPDLCEKAGAELGLNYDDPCDEACAERLARRAADLLTAALERQLRALQGERIDALLVDVTGNGGGTDWVEPAARVLTAKPLRAARLGFIRHEHWVKQFSQRLADIEAGALQAPSAQRRLLAQAAEIYRRALVEARLPVARDAIWNNQKPASSLLVKDPAIYATGALPYLKPGELANPLGGPRVFYPSRYAYHEGAYSGPLIVLVDGRTASAAEYFASMLADNGAATVIGAPTLGAGAGYTNGGIPTILKHSGGKVKLPDCVRYRADGSNEVGGFKPSSLIRWRENDDAYQKAKRVLLTDVIRKHPN